jgi:hypothetical protein
VLIQPTQSDKVKITIPKMIFAIFGDGAGGKKALKKFLDSNKINSHPKVYIMKNQKNKYFSIHLFDNQIDCNIALEASGGYVVYDGHSNYGIGFCFRTGLKKISDFMNVGNNYTAIDWIGMIEDQEHSNFYINYDEYCGESNTTEKYLAIKYSKRIEGNLIDYEVPFYSDKKLNGMGSPKYLSLKNGDNNDVFDDYHINYGDDGNTLIVKAGDNDMPSKGWEKLLLTSCESGKYYYNSFNSGTLFYSMHECSSDETTREFVKAIIEEKDNIEILKAIDNTEKVYDFHKFN